eukprot:764477-Hanusia_phi.AAC.9
MQASDTCTECGKVNYLPQPLLVSFYVRGRERSKSHCKKVLGLIGLLVSQEQFEPAESGRKTSDVDD